MRPRENLVAYVVIAVLLAPAAALAGDPALAEALFREGRAALQRGDAREAAAKLEESQRLDPAPGTLLNLALAEEKLGRLADAWEHARAAGDQLDASDPRRAIARDLHADLDRRVPRITLRIPSGLPQDTRVVFGGTELRDAALNIPMPVDPGTHTIVVRAPGRSDAKVSVVVAERERREVMLHAGEPTPAVVVVDPSARDLRPSSSLWRTTGWVATATGATSLVVGGTFGLLAWDRQGVVDEHCDARGCDAAGFEASRSGDTFATVSTITVIAGLAVVGAGIAILALTAQPAKR